MAEFLTVSPTAAERLARSSTPDIVRRKTTAVAGVARMIAPGTMKQKIRTINSGRGAVAIGIVVCDHPAAVYVIHGTKPHIIRPRTKTVLSFTSRGGGKVFAKIVHHPGTKPNDFMTRALVLSRR